MAFQDLVLADITPRQLEFSSDFTLKSTVDKRIKINSFVLYFDTFYTVSGHPVSPEPQVRYIQDPAVVLADIWPVGS